jgi:hypothetical protein
MIQFIAPTQTTVSIGFTVSHACNLITHQLHSNEK